LPRRSRKVCLLFESDDRHVGQVAPTISAIAFATAGALQIAAPAAIFSGVLAFLGVGAGAAAAVVWRVQSRFFCFLVF